MHVDMSFLSVKKPGAHANSCSKTAGVSVAAGVIPFKENHHDGNKGGQRANKVPTHGHMREKHKEQDIWRGHTARASQQRPAMSGHMVDTCYTTAQYQNNRHTADTWRTKSGGTTKEHAGQSFS